MLRTPLLPIEELTGWSEALTASQIWKSGSDSSRIEKAWQRDVQLLRGRLRRIMDRPEIIHALYVASPSLQAGIEHWQHDPDSKKGLQAERAMVRYFARMATRSTPFGLFSACSAGHVDESRDASVLRLQARPDYRLCCRLDFDYLFALTSVLHRDPAFQLELRYWPNSSLHRIGDAWHYTESRGEETRRTYHLVKVENDPYLEAVLNCARTGATVPELVAAVLTAPGQSGPSQEEAQDYVLGIIREDQLLISNFAPLLTGTAPLDDLIRQLDSLPSGGTTARQLRGIREHIGSLEKRGLSSAPADYHAITAEIEMLPAKYELAKLYQVDMIKPVQEAVLGKAVLSEVIRGVDLLCRIGETVEPDELKLFRKAFSERYGLALVPLMEALDEEAGVGFGAAIDSPSPSPLLRGLMPYRDRGESRWRGQLLQLHSVLMRQVLECSETGKGELELDVSALIEQEAQSPKLADAFYVMGILVAASGTALQAGDFEFYLQGGAGPSGAKLIGRFCHADHAIEAGARNHILQEEEHHPESIFAEVVHLPEGRIGNVLCRPVLRDYEIPYLGRSGAPPERQLGVSDLLVGVEQENIVLYSRRLGQPVIPRATNAHGFTNPRLPAIYRFLCFLQHQHGFSVPGFSWGPLDVLDHLPRVRTGRLVLSLERWRLSWQELEAVGKEQGSRRFLAVQELRRRRKLPRWVVFQEGDNSLVVDLENALSVDAFVHILKRGKLATLVELYPAPGQLCVSGPEGSFYHELQVPFVRKPGRRDSLEPQKSAAAIPIARRSVLARASVSRHSRILPPGGEWLYAKLYGGETILDEILTTALPELVRTALVSGLAARWFFIRYADPHHHLRVRWNVVPERVNGNLLSQVCATFNPLLTCGKLWKIDFDTYDREIERYGGVEGLSVCEDAFFADSEAVLDILGHLSGDEELDIRWRAGLMGIDQLLTDFGFRDQEKLAIVRRWSLEFQREFKMDTAAKKQLSEKFRAERSKLEAMFGDSPVQSQKLQFAKLALAHRSTKMREVVRRLQLLAAGNKLEADIVELAASFAHMHVNRLIRSSQRAHEMVLYDFLCQIYDGRIARKTRLESRTQKTSSSGSPSATAW